MTVTLVRKTNNLEKLAKRLQKLSRTHVSSGYFGEQGDHPEIKLKYSVLMLIHENGMFNNPARPVRTITTFKMKAYGKAWAKDISKYLYHNLHLEELLDKIGKDTTEVAQSVFGTPQLEANSPVTVELKGFNSPLVDSGLLRANWSWRGSVDHQIKNTAF